MASYKDLLKFVGGALTAHWNNASSDVKSDEINSYFVT